MPGVAPLHFGQVIARGFRQLCPRCGRAPLFSGWFRMEERCAACGLRFEREQGFFVGAIYVNYAITIAVVLSVVLLLDWSIGLTLGQQLAIGVALAALVPLAIFRYSRSLWLSVTYVLTAKSERTRPGRARHPPSR